MLQPIVRLMGIEEYRLSNGLRVVLSPDGSKPTFTINLTVLVGSIHEGAGEAGMAHVFEHILFRSLEGFPDVKKTLNGMGADCNGTTWFDRTNFFETLNASEENLETAIRLEAARLGRAELHAEDLEKEGKIVESEFDLRASSPQGLMMRGMLGCMFDFHAYSREPIGTVEDFRSLRMENVRKFYARYYTPDNAVLFVAGQFDPEKVLGLVQTHFGGLKAGSGLPAYTTREPGAQGERRYVVRAAGDAFHVMAGYRVPGASSPDGAAADVLATALSGYQIGLLHKAMVGNGIASTAQAFWLDLRMPCPWAVMASVPKDKDPGAAEAAMLDVLERQAAALPQDDVDRAKGEIDQYRDQIFNNPKELVDKLSQFEAAGSWKLLLVRLEQIKALTAEAVRTFAAKYLRSDNRVVGRFEPDPSAVPVVPDRERPIEDYAEILSRIPPDVKATKEFTYTPASFQASLQQISIGSARIGLIEKGTKGDDVFIHLRMPFSGMGSALAHRIAGNTLAELMTKRTKALTKEGLAAFLAERKSYIGVSIGINGAILGIKTKKNELENVLPLAWEMLRTPFIEEEQVRDSVVQQEGSLKAVHDNPRELMGIEVNRMLFPPDDPRRKLSVGEQLEEVRRLSLASILTFHRRFFGSEGLIGAVVGEVQSCALASILSPLVADGWKAELPPVMEPDDAVDQVVSALVDVPTPGKPSAFSLFVQPLRVSMASPDYVPLEIATLALFQDPLASRIPKKVREEAALGYAVQGQFVAGLDGDFAYILIMAATNPENAGKAAALIKGELVGALDGGLGADEIEAFKKSYKNRLALTRSDDNLISAMAVELWRNGLDFGLWERQDSELDGLTAERVNEVMLRHLKPSAMGLIRIGDFTAIASSS